MKNQTERLLDSQDMGLAVALLCKEYQLAELERPQHGGRVTFRFILDAGINQAAQDYWNGKLEIDAKRFWNEAKNLKTRLYSL
jgi:hypothetical protein